MSFQIQPRLITSVRVSPRQPVSHHVSPCHTMWARVTPRQPVSHHVNSCHTTSSHVKPRQHMSYHVTSIASLPHGGTARSSSYHAQAFVFISKIRRIFTHTVLPIILFMFSWHSFFSTGKVRGFYVYKVVFCVKKYAWVTAKLSFQDTENYHC